MTDWVGQNLGVILVILGHGAASIWFASKINTTVTMGFKALNDNVSKIDKELEKRDIETRATNAAMWKRIDEVRDRVTHLEARS